jgi:hypothetical protein
MTDLGLLDGPSIEALLTEVADVLGPHGPQHTVVVVGGSLLAVAGLRDATEDVDSIRRLPDDLRAAVAEVAQRHDLDADWLNDRATPFMPATFDEGRCSVLLDRPRLRVLGAPLRDVFLMKLYRMDPADVSDMISMWPLIADEFDSADAVAAAFRDAFPAAPDDEHLADFVADAIAGPAGRPLPSG